MVSLALGMLLVASFLVVLQRCRSSFAVNESLARQQDAARHALSVLVPDIEHSGFFGFGRAPPLIGSLPAGIHACGTGFATSLAVPAEGSDNVYRLGADASDCAPTASSGGARAGTDTLTLRHASSSTVAPRAGRLQLYSQSLSLTASPVLFADGNAPGVVDAAHDIRDVEVRTYYIANDSVQRPGWPALRVKALTESRGAAQFRDEEILPGVEDLQVEIGVASFAADGTARLSYVAPDSTRARDGRVVAVRLWLRIRADVTEPGYLDGRSLAYANVVYAPTDAEAKQRRMLIERTVALRNAPAVDGRLAASAGP
jgi:Tfp pilus assembly protein PilW